MTITKSCVVESSLLEWRRRFRNRFELIAEEPAVLAAAMAAQRLGPTRAIVARSFHCRSRRRDGLAGEELLHIAAATIAPEVAPSERPQLLRHATIARTALMRTLASQIGVAETDGPLWQTIAELGGWLLKDSVGDLVALEWQDEGWVRGVLVWSHARTVLQSLVFVD